MSLVEQARTRLEETRDRIKTRFGSIRGGGSNPSSPELLKEIREKGILGVLGGSSSSSRDFPTLKEIREKGVLSVLEEKFPRVKELRGRGILSRREPTGEPRGEVAGEMQEHVILEVEKGVHGEAI